MNVFRRLQRFLSSSLQRKQTLVIMLTSSTALLLASIGFISQEYLAFRRGMVENLSTLAHIVAENTQAALQFNVPEDATATLNLLRSEQAIRAAWIYDVRGEVFAEFQRPESEPTALPRHVPARGTAASARRPEPVHEFSGGLLTLHHSIVAGGQVIGSVHLVSDLDSLYSRLRQYGLIVALLLAASSLVAYALSTRLQRIVSRPILDLARLARLVAVDKNYSARATRQGEDEVGQLMDGFNEMLEQIQQRDAALQAARDTLEKRVQQRTAELEAEITERRKAEQDLWRSQQFFTQIALNANDVLYLWDCPTGAIEYYGQIDKALGYEEGEFPRTEEARRAALHPEDRERVLAATQESITSGRPLSEEYRIARKDGAYAYWSDRGRPVYNDRGEAVKFIGACSDITRRKEQEQQLEEAKEHAVSANQAKGQFLANMSHEIRTPINGILGMTALALETPLNSDQRALLNTVKESADTLLNLINEILDFSKIEAGKMELEHVGFSLGGLIEDTLLTLALRAHQKGLELACHLPPDLPDALLGDPGRLRQVFTNLIGNAIKFTERGEVVISARVESATEDEVVLQFEVRDTGIGIAADKQAMIFEAFTQADASTTRHHGGTGLGLAISRRIVELMGGRIWLSSETGRGSRFHFTARLGRQSLAQAIPESSPSRLRDLSVLIVDDNASSRRILEEHFLRWHMKPRTVAGAAAALEELGRQSFDILLVDAGMPGMDGFALMSRLKSAPKLPGAVIMMLSTAAQFEDAERCRQLGIGQYVTKPVKQSDLLDCVLIALGGTDAGRRRLAAVTQAAALKTTRPARVLLAEDNLVNQRLAVRLLEKFGHHVTVAGNGRKALDLWEREPFDLVLMDVQMPEMNGYEATRAIRQRETVNRSRIPIIAMTAHAMQGDREKCLEAGMDIYVTKPIDQRILFEAVESALIESSNPADKPLDMKTTASPTTFDPAIVLQRVDGDQALLKEVITLFLEDTPGQLAEIRLAAARGDGEALERASHTLKGSVGNFGARAAQELALSLELMGRQRDFARATDTAARLDGEVKRLLPALETWLKEKAA